MTGFIIIYIIIYIYILYILLDFIQGLYDRILCRSTDIMTDFPE